MMNTSSLLIPILKKNNTIIQNFHLCMILQSFLKCGNTDRSVKLISFVIGSFPNISGNRIVAGVIFRIL